jgi:flagellar hook-basal body complex protein FliE
MEQILDKELTKDQVILELIALLKQNQSKDTANNVFEMATYIDGIEKKLDAVMVELMEAKKQLHEIQEQKESKSIKRTLSEAIDKLENSCHFMKQKLFQIKTEVKTKAQEIVIGIKQKGKIAISKTADLLGIKDKLELIRQNVQTSLNEVNQTIDKIDAFGSGLRESLRQAANTFRTFADKDLVDYEAKEKWFSKTEVIKKPWQLKRKLLSGMKLHLDAAIEKLDYLSINAELSKREERIVEPVVKERSDTDNLLGVAEQLHEYGGDAFEAAQMQNLVKSQYDATLAVVSMKEGKNR